MFTNNAIEKLAIMIFSILLVILILDVSIVFALSEIGLLVSAPRLQNPVGERINSIGVGQQAIIEVLIDNNQELELPFVILIEVRDETGVTRALSWQSGILPVDGNYTMSASWSPKDGCVDQIGACDYETRTFVISNLVNPQVLSEVRVAEFTVQMEEAKVKHYTLPINGTEYDIQYFIESGHINSIVVDRELSTLTLSLDEVSWKTSFVIEVPWDVANISFSCGDGSVPEEYQSKVFSNLILFADGIEVVATIVELEANELVRYGLELEAGSKQIEIVRACLA
ncbi:MAG TPA: hypothetical protein VIE86_07955 [Nitrososphaera sp.]|jgi:hypothetical protein